MPLISFNLRRWLPGILCAVVALWLSGCGDRDRLAYATETDEPYYKEGQSLLKTGRHQEALTAFLKVIDKRGEDAPESQLEIGLLYQQHINDPLSAIYHFKKYLALRPNSPLAPQVRQRIDGCIREFARSLPAQPIENAAKRVDLIAAMDKLKLENDQLKQQLADLQANRATAVSLADNAPSNGATPGPPAAENNFSLGFDTIPTVRTRPAAPTAKLPLKPAVTAPLVVAPPPASSREIVRLKSAPAPAATAAPAKTVPRKHVVQKGDTLSNIAQRYYKNKARWKDIYAANRKVMKNESDIHVGMELVIP